MIQIKNAAELQKMRKACAISAAALKAGGEAIEPGITTAEIDKIIYDFIVRHGARPNFLHLYGFPATACISVNDTVIHGIPNKQQQIRPGDIVSIDTGCKIDGFNGDNACTYACGKIDLEAQRLLDVTDPVEEDYADLDVQTIILGFLANLLQEFFGLVVNVLLRGSARLIEHKHNVGRLGLALAREREGDLGLKVLVELGRHLLILLQRGRLPGVPCGIVCE